MSEFSEARYCNLEEYYGDMGRRLRSDNIRSGEPLEVRFELGENGVFVAAGYPAIVTSVEFRTPYGEPAYYQTHLNILGPRREPARAFSWRMKDGLIVPGHTTWRNLRIGRQVVQSGYLIKWEDKHQTVTPDRITATTLPLSR